MVRKEQSVAQNNRAIAELCSEKVDRGEVDRRVNEGRNCLGLW